VISPIWPALPINWAGFWLREILTPPALPDRIFKLFWAVQVCLVPGWRVPSWTFLPSAITLTQAACSIVTSV
jgi:hypothetical protein